MGGGGGVLPKMELKGGFKNGIQKCEEDEIKVIQKWSRGKSAAVYQKEIKLNEKGRSASAIMSHRRYLNYPQK